MVSRVGNEGIAPGAPTHGLPPARCPHHQLVRQRNTPSPGHLHPGSSEYTVKCKPEPPAAAGLEFEMSNDIIRPPESQP
ncbi:hypothetical protein NDU88_005935 [Pleurodeles waltl]|uniref:Uncharacterized protein n=1 Tax=Pleurodeles waltl TaxID=8319 RepID=A0AAV7MAU2_PLEWA|nr:hypothetical protein NDU88_005935 [Pleurodeles waltl]